MKLTKEHRQDLLTALEKAQEERDTYQRCVEEAKQCFDFEAYHFLALQRIETIKKALIDNEIDY